MAFEKHPQERNKQLDQVTINEERWASKQSVYKNTQRLLSRGTNEQKRLNPLREVMFHHLISYVKKLYAQLPHRADRVIVEIPLKQHPLDMEGLHCLLTSHILLELKCDVLCNYLVRFKFHDCPFETEIKAKMKDLGLLKHSIESERLDDYSNYFKTVLQVQPERFIYLL